MLLALERDDDAARAVVAPHRERREPITQIDAVGAARAAAPREHVHRLQLYRARHVERRRRGRVLRVVDFAGDAAATAPLDVARAVALDAVHVLAWRGGAGGADGVDLGDGLTALAVRRDDGAGRVVVALECEEHARQVAHVMTSLDGFAMEAARVSLDAAADAVLARRDCALGVVLLEE